MRSFVFLIGIIFFLNSCYKKLDKELNSNPFDESYEGAAPVIIDNITAEMSKQVDNGGNDTLIYQNLKISGRIFYSFATTLVLYKDGKIIANAFIQNDAYFIQEHIVCAYSTEQSANCSNSGKTFSFEAVLGKGGKYTKKSPEYKFTIP